MFEINASEGTKFGGCVSDTRLSSITAASIEELMVQCIFYGAMSGDTAMESSVEVQKEAVQADFSP